MRNRGSALWNRVMVVLWHALNIEPSEVWAEMRRRVESMGIAEKLPKPRRGTTDPAPVNDSSEGNRVPAPCITANSRAPAPCPEEQPERTRPCAS